MAAQVEADDAPPRHFERLGDAAPDGARLPRAVDEQHRGVVFGADCFGFEPHAGEAAKGQDAHAAPPSHSSNWRERRFIISRATSRSPSMIAVQRGSEEHTSELQSLMRNSYAVVGLNKKKNSPRI